MYMLVYIYIKKKRKEIREMRLKLQQKLKDYLQDNFDSRYTKDKCSSVQHFFILCYIIEMSVYLSPEMIPL